VTRGAIIDGNNLLFAVKARAPVKPPGREGLVRRIEQWARNRPDHVIVAFDGAAPKGGLRDQLSPARLEVRFSAPQTADDLIVGLIHTCPDPGSVEVISDDKAILYEARLRGCRTRGAAEFVDLLFQPQRTRPIHPPKEPAKPENLSADEQAFWRREFNVSDDDERPPDDLDAMRY